MANVIAYTAHPAPTKSVINAELAKEAASIEGVTCVDLYAEYPRFQIDVAKEQARLMAHDVIVLQFPIFWYSSPSLLKEWQDLVLTHGFAFGEDGTALEGKALQLAVSTGGAEKDYLPSGYQNFTLREFLLPFQQTATLCGMKFLSPYAIYDTVGIISNSTYAPHIRGYGELLRAHRDDHYDFERQQSLAVVQHSDLPIITGEQR